MKWDDVRLKVFVDVWFYTHCRCHVIW